MRYAIALLLSLAVPLAWAQERPGAPPSGASQILVRGETYYYSGGVFYRPGDSGYRRVEPPVGARVPDVPGDSGSFTMGGERYVVTPDGAFFRYDPRGDDYAVVSPPPGWRDYYRGPSPELRSLAAPAPQEPGEIPRAYPRTGPGYRDDDSGRYRSDYYGDNLGGGYYGRYRFRDDIYGESRRERRATCRRIAEDQSRRDRVGPYRRQPGSYREEYERCMR